MHRVSNWRDNLIVVGSESGTLYRLETQPSFAPARILKFSLPLLTLFFPLFSSFPSSFFFFFPFLFFLLHSMYNVEDEQKIYIYIYMYTFFFFEEIVSSNIGSNFDPRRSNYMQRSECQRGGAGEKYATNVYVRRPLARR